MRTNSFESIVPSSLSLPKNRAAWFTVLHKRVLSLYVQPTRRSGGGQIKAPPAAGEHSNCAVSERSSYLSDVWERNIQFAQLHLQLVDGHLPEFGTLSLYTAGHAYRLLLDRDAANLQHGHEHCFL